MPTRYNGLTLLYAVLFFLVLIMLAAAETNSHTPARILAKQTGATQFEEERFEAHTDCNDHKHRLKKRSSDEDVDYEVYQGVVGRPGIDFPIYPRIPKTAFSCRSFGNGYFADMDTDCQVFHICEEGRKISFLCPNGTIFQQSELTCDWWFKVNCLGSPGYYAESAEILSKQRLQRVRPSVPVQGFNIVGGGLNIKPKATNSAQPTKSGKPDRNIDSNEQPSLENVDFDDLSAEKQLKRPQNKIAPSIDNNSNDNDNESQITAESASFVNGNRRNIYTYDKSNGDSERKPSDVRSNGRNSLPSSRRASDNGERAAARNGYRNPPESQQHQETTERARSGKRGQQRYRENNKPEAESFERNSSEESKLPKTIEPVEKFVKPVVPIRVIAKSNSGIGISAEDDVKPELYEAQSTRAVSKTQPSTPTYPSGTYSTARRLDSTRTTPFYTPTVPSISKSKTTEDKSFYSKNQGNVGSGSIATTPNPNRFNNGATSGLILSSSDPFKYTPNSAEQTSSSTTATLPTFRPFIIGMRHNYDTSSEIHRISLLPKDGSNGSAPVKKSAKRYESAEYLPTSTPASTGPTYLPKSAKSPKVSQDAAADLLLFAPSSAADDSVSRNVDEMLKTVNLLKDKLEDVDEVKYTGPAREGLDIPPSSGPDVLISLAKYFATEQNGSNVASSPNDLDADTSDKSGRPGSPAKSKPTQTGALPVGSKPSDTTASITTEATIGVIIKGDDIKSGLLSEKTVDKYSNLFGLENVDGRKQDTDLSVGLLSNVNDTDISKSNAQTSLFPQIGTTDATIRQLAEKPESRKIAQVFSNALTTYLEDPKSFREQLASIRPTEPPISGRINFTPVTATDRTLFNGGTAATYLPTKSPTPGDLTTTPLSIAPEINNSFGYSTLTPDAASTTDSFDTTTYRPIHNFLGQKPKLELGDELVAPKEDSGEVGEFLQREQTQSFVKSRNDLSASQDKQAQKSTTTKPTENPWTLISETDFLDPLTINDGLMKESTTTPSAFTYLPKQTTTPLPTTVRGRFQVLSTGSQRLQAQGGNAIVGSAEQTTPHTDAHYRPLERESWQDIFNSYDIPRDSLPSNSGLQRIANKLFGGLNESEALHLKNVMLQAEHNRQVLGLLLLLIQTCDDQNGKALERSRKHLLNALIDMDGKLKDGKGKTAHEKGAPGAPGASEAIGTTTTTRVPVTTYRRNPDDGTTAYPLTTTDLPTTTVYPTRLPGGDSVEETTKFEIRVPDPEEDSIALFSSGSGSTAHNSDERALELLKSLYSLASKFTSRR